MKPFLTRLREPGTCLLGTWVKLPSVESLEILAIAGFDYVVIDMEHAPLDLETTYRCTAAGQGFGLNVLVRLPDSKGGYVQRVLDSGVDGVLVPRVRSPREASEIMEEMLFAPLGSRGLGITSRAGHWGGKPIAQYVEEGNVQTFRGVQLEDQQSLRDAAGILDVEGVNAAFVGPGDLALSSGKPATHPDNAALIEQLLAVASDRNVPCGTAVGDADGARQARERGFRFVMVSNDTTMFLKAAREIAGGFRKG